MTKTVSLSQVQPTSAVMDGAYHGHTRASLDLSPYKFDGPGGSGRPPYVHVLPCPDPYRGLHLDGRAAAQAAIAEARAAGGRIAAFFSESVLSCGGQVVFPDGYLADVYDEMRQEGAMCVADEVRLLETEAQLCLSANAHGPHGSNMHLLNTEGEVRRCRPALVVLAVLSGHLKPR